jgi:hypothetical protein
LGEGWGEGISSVLYQIAEAHELMESGKAIGNIILEIVPE